MCPSLIRMTPTCQTVDNFEITLIKRKIEVKIGCNSENILVSLSSLPSSFNSAEYLHIKNSESGKS